MERLVDYPSSPEDVDAISSQPEVRVPAAVQQPREGRLDLHKIKKKHKIAMKISRRKKISGRKKIDGDSEAGCSDEDSEDGKDFVSAASTVLRWRTAIHKALKRMKKVSKNHKTVMSVVEGNADDIDEVGRISTDEAQEMMEKVSQNHKTVMSVVKGNAEGIDKVITFCKNRFGI